MLWKFQFLFPKKPYICLLGLAISAAGQANGSPMLPAALLARAEAEGSVRVIVELSVEPAGIGGAQDLVLQSLEGTQHRVTRRYQTVPLLGLEVSAEALRRLARSPAVRNIQEDRVLTPQENTP
jgi:hypothetical protein